MEPSKTPWWGWAIAIVVLGIVFVGGVRAYLKMGEMFGWTWTLGFGAVLLACSLIAQRLTRKR